MVRSEYMKGLFDILSGGRLRRNQCDEITFSQPLERYNGSSLAGHPMLKAYAFSLASTVKNEVQAVIFESGVPEYEAVGKRLDKAAIADLASLLAWDSAKSFQDDQIEAGDDPNVDVSTDPFFRDTWSVMCEMYPPSPLCKELTDAVLSAEEARDEAMGTRFVTTWGRSIDRALGLTVADGDVSAFRRYTTIVMAILIANKHGVAEHMEIFAPKS